MSLNDKVKKLFSQYEGTLNARVVSVEVQKTEDGKEYFEAPIATLTKGGATVFEGNPESVSLFSPAKADFNVKKMLPKRAVYRIAFNVEDAAKAESDDVYFNTLVAPILKEAVARWESAFGSPELIRYGRAFCKVEDLIDQGEFVEMRLTGNWASDKLLENN